MEQIDHFLKELESFVWGTPLLLLLLGTGAYLTFLLKGMQFRYLGFAFRQILTSQKKDSKGDISHFQALMTSLAGAIGTGSIVGVATAMTIGGVGALFWMWITAFLGMATKYAESLLAVKYREIDRVGEMSGGPMQYIEKGLGWKWMAILFGILGIIATLGTGNLVQANAIAESIHHVWQISPLTTGILLACVTAIVIIGGVKSIGQVASVLVPFMALFYISAALFIILLKIDLLPDAIALILRSAWTGQAASGGFLGATVMVAIQVGVSRSILSNEAGLGIPAFAAAAAKTDSPGRQAMITMTGALISTVIVCTMTGLVLALTQVIGLTTESGQPLTGASLAIVAFNSQLWGGEYIVTIGLVLFAYTTILAWAYYGEKCCEYLFGEQFIRIYRILFACMIIPGAILKLDVVWYLANISNGLMAIPNLIALIGLSGVIVNETKVFLTLADQEKKELAIARSRVNV